MVSGIFSFQSALKLQIPCMDMWLILEVCNDWSMCATAWPAASKYSQLVTDFLAHRQKADFTFIDNKCRQNGHSDLFTAIFTGNSDQHKCFSQSVKV